jgi:hypothetical protein
MPVFAIVIFMFVAFATIQFSRGWGDAQRGLLLFEKACPLNISAAKPAI